MSMGEMATATVQLRGVTLGEGAPKICVPLIDATADALAATASALPFDVLDLVELRIDFFDEIGDADAVTDALSRVRSALPDGVPVLFTFRSLREGGQRELATGDYEALIALAADSGLVDAVDVEMFTPADALGRIVAHAHDAGVPVVMSSHDFDATPPREEIVGRLRRQQELGADVVKIAVMPRSPRDVVTLLDATEEFTATAARPAITMSMGPLGVASRVAGEVFGSCLTFGAVGTVSAPGQLAAADLRVALDVLHAAASSDG
ncbi:3-dehydroquinate dehydratase [Homoserinimonas aerilata]|uniref:3-dehydroquinate dehydratase n=1 Tax=Homoserinimonas aerilata TaxID=1162970 RepID=A0A542YHB8_9MICO|nr:type I 3-dehydroquinate dehydratase [Homoserinimonas aerilata]TQL47490.1 3-dehydroquinate dehydratase [Homoserinimonas aerilata]